jgi:hypothetical protein
LCRKVLITAYCKLFIYSYQTMVFVPHQRSVAKPSRHLDDIGDGAQGADRFVDGGLHRNRFRRPALLSMLLIPGQPLIIEYSPQAPGDGVRALIARCAKVFNYDIVEPPATQESVAPHPQHAAPRPASVWGGRRQVRSQLPIELYVTALHRSPPLPHAPLPRRARGASSETGSSSGFVILRWMG